MQYLNLRRFVSLSAVVMVIQVCPAASSAQTNTNLVTPIGVSTQQAEILQIPAGTQVVLKVESPVSSKTAAKGEAFDFSLAEDIVVGGVIVIPIGTKGKGQVVHAERKGFGGRAGELILAARYLDTETGQLKLRGFSVSKTGANNTAEALLIPLAGVFITGTSAEVEVGQLGIAKTKEVFEVKPTLTKVLSERVFP